MAQLPGYIPSGNGAAVDLKNILISQSIAWGAFKGQFGRKYKKLAGTKYVDGVEVYNDIPLMGKLSPDTETYKFMKFIGFSDDDLERLNKDITNPDAKVEQAWFGFQIANDYEQEDFDMALNFVFGMRSHFDFIDVSIRNNAYRANHVIPAPTLDQYGLSYSTPLTPFPNDLGEYRKMMKSEPKAFMDGQDTGSGSSREPVVWGPIVENLTDNMEIRAYKNGQDVTRSIPLQALKFLVVFSMMEPSMVSKQTVALMERNTQYSYQLATYDFIEVVRTERLTFHGVQLNFLKKNRLGSYTMRTIDKGPCKDCTDEEKDALVPRGTQADWLWLAFYESIDKDIEEVTEGLFYMKKRQRSFCEENPESPLCRGQEGWEEQIKEDIYLRVDAIKKIDPNIFGYYMSAFMYIKTKRKKAGFFKRFIGGLIRAILSLIGAVLELFLKVPILKQITEGVIKVVASIFGVSGATALEILKQVILSIILIVVTPIISSSVMGSLGIGTTTGAVTSATGLSVGMMGGVNTALTYSSYAMQAFQAGMNGRAVGEAKEHAEKKANDNYRRNKALEATRRNQAGFIGTMGTMAQHQTSDFLMYEAMFNPLTYMEQALPPEELPNGYLF
jgi:hypothetical protein